MMRSTVQLPATFYALAIAFIPSQGWGQTAGTRAQASAGSLCCATQPGTDVNGSANLNRSPRSDAAASFASGPAGVSNALLANSSAYADLSSGKIGAAGISSNYAFTSATAGYQDILRFDIAGANASTITPITFNILYHGTIDPGYGGVNTQLVLNAFQTRGDGAYVGTGGLGVTRSKGSGNDQQNFYSNVQNSGWLGFAATPNQAGDTYSIRAVLGLIGASPVLTVDQFISLTTFHAASADFSHTASLSLDVPTGTTFISASGLFLSKAAGAVPEPATWVMMLAGLGMAAAILRKRRRDLRGSIGQAA